MSDDQLEHRCQQIESQGIQLAHLEALLEEKQHQYESLLQNIETCAEKLSCTLSRLFFLLSLPMLIGMLNYQVMTTIHPAQRVLVLQLSLSGGLVMISISMALLEAGLTKKLKNALKRIILENLIKSAAPV